MDVKGDGKGDGNVSPAVTALIPDEGTYVYVAVKGSLHANDCGVFGLRKEEINAIVGKFPGSNMGVINGVNVLGAPMTVINALGQLGYKVVSTTGEAEITWTLQREI